MFLAICLTAGAILTDIESGEGAKQKHVALVSTIVLFSRFLSPRFFEVFFSNWRQELFGVVRFLSFFFRSLYLSLRYVCFVQVCFIPLWLQPLDVLAMCENKLTSRLRRK
jgi:hypothetical protein